MDQKKQKNDATLVKFTKVKLYYCMYMLLTLEFINQEVFEHARVNAERPQLAGNLYCYDLLKKKNFHDLSQPYYWLNSVQGVLHETRLLCLMTWINLVARGNLPTLTSQHLCQKY